MIDSQSPKANLARLGFSLLGISLLVALCNCASTKRCDGNPSRVSLEKKIFNLEDQIESQKKKIKSLQSELVIRKPATSNLEEMMGDTLVDSSLGDMSGYYEAIRFRDTGNYDEAVEKLNRFLVENPDHVYSDRAQFLILDSHFRNQEYGMVLMDSFLLETKFRESRKLPEALHKRALSYLKLGDKQKGVETLKMLIELFPQSAVSPVAKESLVSLQSSEIKE